MKLFIIWSSLREIYRTAEGSIADSRHPCCATVPFDKKYQQLLENSWASPEEKTGICWTVLRNVLFFTHNHEVKELMEAVTKHSQDL